MQESGILCSRALHVRRSYIPAGHVKLLSHTSRWHTHCPAVIIPSVGSVSAQVGFLKRLLMHTTLTCGRLRLSNTRVQLGRGSLQAPCARGRLDRLPGSSRVHPGADAGDEGGRVGGQDGFPVHLVALQQTGGFAGDDLASSSGHPAKGTPSAVKATWEMKCTSYCGGVQGHHWHGKAPDDEDTAVEKQQEYDQMLWPGR